MQRSDSPRSSGPWAGEPINTRPRTGRSPSARPARACSRACSVSAGIRPSGGSTMSDVRRSPVRLSPQSHQKSLYARSTSRRAPPSRRSAFRAAIDCCSNSAASSAVNTGLSFRLAGRSSGVIVRKSQIPPRSGAPQAVRGAAGSWAATVCTATTPDSMRTPATIVVRMSVAPRPGPVGLCVFVRRLPYLPELTVSTGGGRPQGAPLQPGRYAGGGHPHIPQPPPVDDADASRIIPR